jgi:hypothetical protein
MIEKRRMAATGIGRKARDLEPSAKKALNHALRGDANSNPNASETQHRVLEVMIERLAPP